MSTIADRGAAPARKAERHDRARRVLVGLELVTGAAALAGGILLVVRPDGSLLRADPAALTYGPFTDWRIPGILLGMLVGVGLLVAGRWQVRGGWHARELSILAGLGLVLFELTELGWIGFQPLEVMFALVGTFIAALAWRLYPPKRLNERSEP